MATMTGFSLLELLSLLVLPAIGLVIVAVVAYWVIRWAVAAGIRDAERRRDRLG